MQTNIHKTKAQLIEEIEVLRKRIIELEITNECYKQNDLSLSIIDHAPFSIWASQGKNGNYKIVLWNNGAEKIYGFSKDEAIGQNYLDLFISDEERADSAKDCESIISEGKVFKHFLAEDIAQDGTKRTIVTNCFRIWDSIEQQYLQVEIGLDISELEKSKEENHTLREFAFKLQAAKEKLIKFLERLRAVTTSITSSLHEEEGLVNVLRLIVNSVDVLINQETTSVIYLYDTADSKEKEFCIFSRDDSTRTSFSELDTNDIGNYAMRIKNAVFLDKGHRSYNNDLKLKPEEEREHSIAVLPLVSDSKPFGLLFVQLDKDYEFSEDVQEVLRLFAEEAAIAVENARLIEDLRKASQLVAEKQEIETRFTLAIDFVHRMNNLVGAILPWADLIKENLYETDPRDQKIQEYLGKIRRDTEELLEEVDKLQQPPERELIDLKLILESMLNNITIQYPEVSIVSTIPDNLYHIYAIRSQLSPAILNVLNNALDAMTHSQNRGLIINCGNISVGDKKGIKISVNDTGCGIPLEQRDKIFKIGFSTKNPNRGYGLWRSKNVIEDLGGRINFESELDIGTEFEIFLPSTFEPMIDADNTQIEKKHILIVDDQQRWFEVLDSILNSNYTTTWCCSFTEAEQVIDSSNFALAVLDVRLKDEESFNVQGIALLQKIKKAKPNTGIVILTGHPDSIRKEILETYKPDAFFTKGKAFNYNEFRETINRIINKKE